jgi:hypothetical protein
VVLVVVVLHPQVSQYLKQLILLAMVEAVVMQQQYLPELQAAAEVQFLAAAALL